MPDLFLDSSAKSTRIEKVLPSLVCPFCRKDLDLKPDNLFCAKCDKSFPIKKSKIYFHEPPQRTDDLDSLKGWLKRHMGSWYYKVGVDVIAPDFPFCFERVTRRYIDPNRALVVDVGSGNRRTDQNIIMVDFFDYSEVDIVCDIFALPFKDSSVDAFISRSVLEHVRKPHKIVDIMKIQTKPGGYSLHVVPFLYPFHASPDDFQRWTHRGLIELFAPWPSVEVRSVAGPVSAFLANTVEFLSVLLSFGSEKGKSYVYLFLCLIVFPVKFLDIFFIPFRSFVTLSLMVLGVFQKPEEE